MKKLLLLFFLSCFNTLLADEKNIDTQSPYLKLIERSDSAVKAEDYSAALDFINEALRLEPANPSNILLLSNAGMLQYYLGEDSLALETLNTAHAIAPVSVTILSNRAKVLNAMGETARALADYITITRLDSTWVDAWRQKALLQLGGGDIRGAEKSVAKVLELEPETTESWLTAGIFYSSTGKPAEAIPFFSKLLKKEKLPEYYSARAMCRILVDDLGGASEDIADGLELNRYDSELLLARALLNKRRFREKDAEADAVKAIEAGADPKRVKLLMGTKF